MDARLREKHARLQAVLRELESVAVAYSGGVDSALLLKVAVDTLGAERAVAVTGRSASVPAAEMATMAQSARALGAQHVFVDTGEFEDPNYTSNPANRCYFCKQELFGRLQVVASQRGLRTVVSGANADDLGDYRPGMDAGRESGVRSPLVEAGFTKQDVRALAAALGLAMHDKPAAPCLSSRIPYGQAVTVEKLQQVDAGETYLRQAGFRECRVRHHGELARIEVRAEELSRLMAEETRTRVEAYFRELGFRYVTVDMRGFRSGSLNEVLMELPVKGE